MALFKTKKAEKKVEKKTPQKEKAVSTISTESVSVNNSSTLQVLIRPRITEKATDNQQNNVYTFEVHSRATKKSISDEFQKIYKVKPFRVNLTKNPAKKIMLRGKVGMTKNVNKAYIYLKKEDRIELI